MMRLHSLTLRTSLLVISFFALHALALTAAAQTTQPTGASPAANWQQSVNKLADALRGKELDTLMSVLDRGPVIRTFASESLQPPERLLGVTAGATVLGLHAYDKPPVNLASDLAEDFKSASGIDDGFRRDMIPADADAEKKANETACKWIAQTLAPDKNSPIAAIILWRQDRADSISGIKAKPVFVLVKGQLVDGQFIIRQVVFGDPLETTR